MVRFIVAIYKRKIKLENNWNALIASNDNGSDNGDSDCMKQWGG